MGFRFWRRVKLAPGVTLNLSKRGGSLSFGRRGARLTLGGRGGPRTTFGIPGTGLFYTTVHGKKKKRGAKEPEPVAPETSSKDKITLGFFDRLVTPAEEESLVDGIKALVEGDAKKAYDFVREATDLADGGFLAGFLALKFGEYERAAEFLTAALAKEDKLGTYFQKYGVEPAMSLPITEEISAHAGPSGRAVLLGLVEVYQRLERWEMARDIAKTLGDRNPDDIVAKLSQAELLLEMHPEDQATCEEVVRLAGDVENESDLHAVLMLYKARALEGLGMLDGARNELTQALRKKKDRSDEVRRALRYERALIYEKKGRKARARGEFEKIYADDPDFEDVAQRLGAT